MQQRPIIAAPRLRLGRSTTKRFRSSPGEPIEDVLGEEDTLAVGGQAEQLAFGRALEEQPGGWDRQANRVPRSPPMVEYELTELGQSPAPVLLSMRDWGERLK